VQKTVCASSKEFANSDQHDSQEFLSALLDGLHEDLNRVLAKPPAPSPTPEREAELETLSVQIASEQEWQIYQMRNDSLVVDYFQGQFRNRVECLTCRKVRCVVLQHRVLLLTSCTDEYDIQLVHVFVSAYSNGERDGQGHIKGLFGLFYS